MVLRIALVVVCILFVGSTSASTVTPWPASFVVVPGHSIGPISLGMTQTMVLNRLGVPHEINRTQAGPSSEDVYWVYRIPNSEDLLIVGFTEFESAPREQSQVDFLYTDTSRATIGGLAIGSSTVRAAVERYGWFSRFTSSGWFLWPQLGMRMRFSNDGVLRAVAIFPKSP